MSDAVIDVVSRYAAEPVFTLRGDQEAAQHEFRALVERCAVEA
jgi:hypothetical protein